MKQRRFKYLILLILIIGAIVSVLGWSLLSGGFSARDEPSSAEAYIARRTNNEEDKESWALVDFIRHLPNITDEEVAAMKTMNPKSPRELEKEERTR